VGQTGSKGLGNPAPFRTVAVLAVIYFVAAKLGLKLAFVHPSATPVWPPAGITLAALLLLGYRVWPGILAGAFLANLTTEGNILTSLGIATGNTLEGLVGAWLVRRFAGGPDAFERPRDVFGFTVLAGVVSTMVSATFGVTSLSLGGFAPWSDYGPVWLTWWLGDAAGVLIVAPLLILCATKPWPPRDRRRTGEAMLLLSALLLGGFVIFGGLLPSGMKNDAGEILCLPWLLWAAFRFSQREAATATTLLAGIAIWGTLRGFGPFARESPNASLLLLQVFMGVIGVTMLAVAAAVSERKRAQEALARTAAIVDSSDDAIVGETLEGVIVSWSAGARRLYGYTEHDVVGRSVSILIPPDRPNEMPEILEKIRSGQKVERYGTVRVRSDGRPVVVSLSVSPVKDVAGRIVGASAIARDVTEEKRAERRLVTQFAVTRILAESTTLREAAPQLLGTLCEGLEWDGAEFWRVEAGVLRREAQWPPPATTIVNASDGGLMGPGEDLAGRAWQSGQHVWVENGAAPKGLAGKGAAMVGLRTAVAWPLWTRNEVGGVLVLYSRERKEPRRDLVEILDDIGDRLAQFVERERTLEGLLRLKKAVETLEMGVTITDINGRILYTNAAEAAMHGYQIEELIGKHVSIFTPQERDVAADRPPEIRSWRREIVNVRRDGTIFPVQLLSDAVTGPDGALIGIVTCCEEITERKRAEEALRSSEERYRLLFERNLAGVYRATLEGRLLECNEAFAGILGFASREQALARTAWDLFFNRKDREALIARLEEKGTLTNFELRMRRKDGSAVWVLENQTLLPANEGEGVVEGTLIDITERRLTEERIEFHAYHDPLTGLPNRMFLKDRLHLALAQARRSGRGLAVIFLDLDHFKEVNDSLGHAIGDRLLQEVAGRLKDCVREDDTVARLGGDEFVLLLPRVRHGEGAAHIAQKVLGRMGEPFRLSDRELHVTTSAGIALSPGDGEDAETLLKNADDAMYRAKELGRNAYQFSSPVAGR
jgi:diguanylate cyclase (GGDEF)-like protein/PAS domain S-box-containing protein